MAERFSVISPVDGSVFVERSYARPQEVEQAVSRAQAAQRAWRSVSLSDRQAVCQRFVTEFEQRADSIAKELTWQMGRPLLYTPGEVKGLAERARSMIEAAPAALADIFPPAKERFHRWIRREPLGVVFTIAAWNYPYLIAVNSVIPAILAGNTVLLKHSAQTPLCAERFAECFQAAGLPEGVFQYLHLDHTQTDALIRDPRIDFVAFTGSVRGGHAVQEAAGSRFVGTGLELGGKDPAYVRADAPFEHSVENLVDGAFFNSGQSCCAIERIYVHRDIYSPFVEAFVALTKQYRLGDPTNREHNLGPMVRSAAAQFVQDQISAAVAAGAKPLIDPTEFPAHQSGSPYLAPQVLVDVDHTMELMTEESFGPVVGIMRVRDDEEAVALMNDSRYGLTASVWTSDEERAIQLGEQVQTGTWFMNRCDYLDPALAWVGVKDSGRGCTLSSVGFEYLTRPKSFHLRQVEPATGR